VAYFFGPPCIFSVFHLYNIKAHRQVNLCLNDERFRHKPNPVYLGITLDRSLSFREHLQKTAAKVATRNNRLSLLAGSSWGASAATLRKSALTLCYSTEEYCAPVWSRSSHAKLIDIQLNKAVRILSGTLQSTLILWLPVLSHIPPPHLWREDEISKLLNKAEFCDHLPLSSDVTDHPTLIGFWRINPDADTTAPVSSRWREVWQSVTVINSSLVNDSTVRAPSFHLLRRQWSLVNRFRTGQGHCGTCRKNGVWQTMKCLSAATSRQCHTSLIPVRWPNSTVVYNVYNPADKAAVDWLTSYGT